MAHLRRLAEQIVTFSGRLSGRLVKVEGRFRFLSGETTGEIETNEDQPRLE